MSLLLSSLESDTEDTDTGHKTQNWERLLLFNVDIDVFISVLGTQTWGIPDHNIGCIVNPDPLQTKAEGSSVKHHNFFMLFDILRHKDIALIHCHTSRVL